MTKREVRYLRKVDLIIDKKRDSEVLSAALGKRIERLLTGKRSKKNASQRSKKR